MLDLETHYAHFEADFLRFFPDLCLQTAEFRVRNENA
jgi:hypothetical protein